MPSAKSETLTSLPIWMSFISFSCLIAENKTSNTMLNNSGENGHPCHVPDRKGKALIFSPLRMILAVGFSCMAFTMFKCIPSITTFLTVFIKKGYCVLSNDFFASVDRIIWFISFLLLM